MWAKRITATAVEQERQSPASAAYFEKLVDDLPELSGCLEEAHRLMNGNEPHALTRFQQSQVVERLSAHTSGVASERLMQTRREESSARRFTQDGTPTGENYWMEAGNLLASPAVPGYVKDELLKDLQGSRSEQSPAFVEPSPKQFPVSADPDYAEHVRRQKRRLLDGSDILF